MQSRDKMQWVAEQRRKRLQEAITPGLDKIFSDNNIAPLDLSWDLLDERQNEIQDGDDKKVHRPSS